MLKCIAKCSKGFDRCCFNCQLKDLCEVSCTKSMNDPKTCKCSARSEEVRAKKRKSETDKRFWRINIILFVLTLLILAASLVIIGNQNSLMVMNTDILNQQNNILLELDKQSIDNTEENGSEVDSEALTGEARDIVERVVAAESRGEDLQTMMAVAQVIKDRSDLWDMHPVDVVFAEGQFAKPYAGEISDEVKLAVANVFDGGMRVFDQPTTHFYDNSISAPYWTEEKVNRGSIGRMEFWY